MSLFDARSFLSQSLDGALDTKSIPLPPAQRIPFQVTEVSINQGSSTDDSGKAREWYKYVARCETTDSGYLDSWKLKKEDGSNMDKASLRYEFFLEVNEGGGIAMGPGKNVNLGKFREACGVNKPGKALDAAIGQMLRFDVKNSVNKNTGDMFAEPINPVPY